MDPATLAVGAAVGGGVGTLAAIVLWALLGRFVWRTYAELDSIRDRILEAQAKELEELRERVYELELEKRKHREAQA